MKVRHQVVRDLHWSVVDEGRDYFIVSTDGATWALPKSQYEPIPTDRWQDVTGECEVDYPMSGGTAIHNTGANCPSRIYLQAPQGYRLRKVQTAVWSDEQHRYVSDPKWVFLVERKVE